MPSRSNLKRNDRDMSRIRNPPFASICRRVVKAAAHVCARSGVRLANRPRTRFRPVIRLGLCTLRRLHDWLKADSRAST